MSETFAVEATIGRPIEEVWAVLTDWNEAHRWMPGIERIRSDDGSTRQGSKLTFLARGKERQSEILSLEEGRLIVLRSRQGGVTADYRYELQPIGSGGTKATLVADCRTEGLLWNAFAPLLRIAIRRTDGGQLQELKKVVENR